MARFKPQFANGDFGRYYKELERASNDARLQWANAHDATREAQQMCAEMRSQIEVLAQSEKFRERYLDVMLKQILGAALRGICAKMGNLQILDRATGELVIQVSHGFHHPFLEYFQRVHEGQAACGVALATGMRQLVEDTTSSEVFQHSPSLEALLDANVRAVISIPLVGHEGGVVGVISTHFEEPRRFAPAALHCLEFLARKAAAVIEWHAAKCATIPMAAVEPVERH